MNIRSINSVRLIREHIEYQFARFKREPHRTDYLTFVVGGAGFTGIEFVGELADRIPELCKQFDVDPSLVKIYNIEAAPTALPGFDPELVEYAMACADEEGCYIPYWNGDQGMYARRRRRRRSEEIKSAYGDLDRRCSR